jgi:hypothetical protein
MARRGYRVPTRRSALGRCEEAVFAVFRCSSRKFTVSEHFSAAESLDSERFGERHNSETARCFSLFPAVLFSKMPNATDVFAIIA